jgi:uncharacterized membrane protein YobD (UPF0266 family)
MPRPSIYCSLIILYIYLILVPREKIIKKLTGLIYTNKTLTKYDIKLLNLRINTNKPIIKQTKDLKYVH